MLKKKLEHIIKHNRFIQWIYRTFASLFFRFVGIFIKMDDNLVLMNGHGFRYNDSPHAIFLKMRELGMLEKYHVVWALANPRKMDIPDSSIVKMDTWKYFCIALKAKYWISCVNIERGLRFKKKKTIYLNTWHGASLNYVGNAVSGRNDFHFEHVNFFCYNGEYERDFIIRDFNVRPEALIPTGYPRNDRLYRATSKETESLRKKLRIPHDKKVILYAPTWRESTNRGNSYDLVPPINWDEWKKKLGAKYIILLRTHPYTTKLMNVEFDDFVRNCIDYPDVNDLLIVADILISDYSCIQLDQSILCKPQFCYGYDFDDYSSKRGFYFDMEKTMPNGVIKDQNILIEKILGLDYKQECIKTRLFKDAHMEYGGKATIECINIVFNTKFKENC